MQRSSALAIGLVALRVFRGIATVLRSGDAEHNLSHLLGSLTGLAHGLRVPIGMLALQESRRHPLAVLVQHHLADGVSRVHLYPFSAFLESLNVR